MKVVSKLKRRPKRYIGQALKPGRWVFIVACYNSGTVSAI